VFWVIATNYRNFRVFGSILLSGFAVAGVVAASITCFLVFPSGVNTLRDAMLLLQRYASIVMVVVLAGTRLTLPESPRIPIPVNARRAADILVLDAVLGMVTAWVARAYGFNSPGVIALFPTTAGVLLGALWLMAAKPVEDRPMIQRSAEDLASEERESALAMHRATAQVREAARLLHRQ
jgi:predicted acyltransferase